MATIVDVKTKAAALTTSANALAVIVADLRATASLATQADLDELDTALTDAQTAIDTAANG